MAAMVVAASCDVCGGRLWLVAGMGEWERTEQVAHWTDEHTKPHAADPVLVELRRESEHRAGVEVL